MLRISQIIVFSLIIVLMGCEKEKKQKETNVLTIEEFWTMKDGPFNGYVAVPKATTDSMLSTLPEYSADSTPLRNLEVQFFDPLSSDFTIEAIYAPEALQNAIEEYYFARLICPTGTIPVKVNGGWTCADDEPVPLGKRRTSCSIFHRPAQTGTILIGGCRSTVGSDCSSSPSDDPYCQTSRRGVYLVVCACGRFSL